jgi:hypothetical protein
MDDLQLVLQSASRPRAPRARQLLQEERTVVVEE